jgi:hypothetical protein
MMAAIAIAKTYQADEIKIFCHADPPKPPSKENGIGTE